MRVVFVFRTLLYVAKPSPVGVSEMSAVCRIQLKVL